MKKRTQRVHHTFVAALMTSLACGLAISSPAASQTTSASADGSPYVAVISTDGAYLRSGAAKTYYPMVQFQRGDLVEVVGGPWVLRLPWRVSFSQGPTRGGFGGY